MAEFPALPIYTDALLGDTQHLSLEELGAYLKLLFIAWRTAECALPDDDLRLARMLGITRRKWASLRPSIEPFWMVQDGFWRQKRLTKTRLKVAKKSSDNRKAAERRWGHKPLKTNMGGDANAYAEPDANAFLTKTKTNIEDTSVSSNPPYPPNPAKPSKPRKRSAVVLPEWVPKEQWEGFVKMRKARNRPLTNRAIKLVIDRLQELKEEGHLPEEALDMATERGWFTVYPPKEWNNGKRSLERGCGANGGEYRRSIGLEMLWDAASDAGLDRQ